MLLSILMNNSLSYRVRNHISKSGCNSKHLSHGLRLMPYDLDVQFSKLEPIKLPYLLAKLASQL